MWNFVKIEKLRPFHNLVNIVLLPGLIKIIAVNPGLKGLHLAKSNFSESLHSQDQMVGNSLCFHALLLDRRERMRDLEKSLSACNGSCSPQLFNLFHRKAQAVGIVFQNGSTKAYRWSFLQTDSKPASLAVFLLWTPRILPPYLVLMYRDLLLLIVYFLKNVFLYKYFLQVTSKVKRRGPLPWPVEVTL